MSDRLLFVDDDPSLLSALERTFRRRFSMDTAEDGPTALGMLGERGPYAVIVADMQMPGMNGVEVLSRAQGIAPDTVRIMLTGNADLEAAIRVVNEGKIFRFLTKPCDNNLLAQTLEAGIAQYRLITAEKELLTKTLNGSTKLLTDILSMVDAPSFGRAESLRAIISEVEERIEISNPWEVYMAAMLAPVGYVTLPPETVLKARQNKVLSKAEESLLTRVPEVTARLLNNIPRLEGVARIVHYHQKHFDGAGFPEDAVKGEQIPFAARLLKILGDMIHLQASGMSRLDALDEMQRRQGWYDPQLLVGARAALLGAVKAGPDATRATVSVTVKDLVVGMVLRSNVETRDGTLVAAKGHQINDMTLEKIENFEQLSGIKEPIFVEADEAAEPGPA